MKSKIYKHVELTGTSPKSIEEAIDAAIRRASKTLKNLSWFEVIETRGSIEKGRVQEWQVTIRIGFLIED
jgi:hypothetical protein